MRRPPHHSFRDMLYGDPARAVPWICAALGMAAGVLTRSPVMGLATTILGSHIWDRLSPNLVIEDPRLGAMTLTCPRRSVSGKKQVWLTFDDGPGPETEAVLNVLQDHGVPATFFFIGQKAAVYDDVPGLRQRLVNGGHRVGNHSWSHPNFLTVDSQRARGEIEEAHKCLTNAFPESLLPIFRPPYGYRTESLFTHLRAANLSVVGWSVNSLDFLSGSTEALVQRVMAHTEPGSIILFHDGPDRRARTVRALPAILAGLKAQGYDFLVPDAEALS